MNLKIERTFMSKTTNSNTTLERYSTRYYTVVDTVSTASSSVTRSDEELTIVAKPMEQSTTSPRPYRELRYKYQGNRIAKIKRINALRNVER